MTYRKEQHLEQADSTTSDWYNATIIDRIDLTDQSSIFRIQPDDPLFEFQAGQYTAIGLLASSQKCVDSDPDEDDENGNHKKRIIRAYSIASSSKVRDYVELYITLVRSGALTPRLWMLQPSDRLWLNSKARGQFTMEGVAAECNVVLIGTGTGLAPYISMIHDHHRCNIGRKFVVVHGARYERDLGYRDELEALQRDCRTMVYVPTVSRPENGTRWTGHIGRVQSVFQDGALEDALGDSVTPDQTHVFVSGNPEMVEDLEDKLIERGFNLHNSRSPGTLHTERYW